MLSPLFIVHVRDISSTTTRSKYNNNTKTIKYKKSLNDDRIRYYITITKEVISIVNVKKKTLKDFLVVICILGFIPLTSGLHWRVQRIVFIMKASILFSDFDAQIVTINMETIRQSYCNNRTGSTRTNTILIRKHRTNYLSL